MWKGRRLLEAPDSRESSTRREVLGASGNLHQALADLAGKGRLVEEASLDREETRVMLEVADAAAELKPISARLEAAIGKFLTPPPAE